MVGQPSAGFMQDQIARCHIPIMLARQGKRCIVSARSHQRQTIGDRVALLDLHGRPWPIGRHCPARMIEQRFCRKHAASFDLVAIAGVDGRAVQRGAAAGRCAEALLRDRIEHDTDNRPCVLHDGNRNRKMRVALEEGNGAVDRVHDKRLERPLPFGRVERFLGQPAIVRTCAGQRFAQELIDSQIGFRHRLAFALVPSAVCAAKIGSGNFTGAAHGMFDEGEVVRHRQSSCLRRAE